MTEQVGGMTVGIDLGGGIISRGRLFRGSFGMAGEIGHYRAVPDGLPCRRPWR